MTFNLSKEIYESKAAIDTMQEQLRRRIEDEVVAALEEVKASLQAIQSGVKDVGIDAVDLDNELDELIEKVADVIAVGLK